MEETATNGRTSNALSPAKNSAAAARTYTRLVTGPLVVSGQLRALSLKWLVKCVPGGLIHWKWVCGAVRYRYADLTSRDTWRYMHLSGELTELKVPC